MVKVGSMNRARRILLTVSILLLGVVSTADAGLFGRKTSKASEPAATAAPSAIVLTAVEVDGSQVVLRTSGAPAYTSYSPAPGVFVIDLTGTGRDAAVAIPHTLPPAVVSIAAEEVEEMGNRLTRITFRLSEPLTLDVATADRSLTVTVPATAVPIQTAPAVAEVLPAVVPVAPQPEPEAPRVEPITEPAPVEVAEPVAQVEEIPLPRARSVKRIDAVTNDGNVDVQISGDGELHYKSFKLENPSRVVIDIDGVKSAVAKNSVPVDDDVVQRVRVAQFQPTVARVVIDLAHKSDYRITSDGGVVHVAFGGDAQVAAAPAQVEPEPVAPQKAEVIAPAPEPVRAPAPAPAPAPVRKAAADIPSQVPTIADNAPVWKMPEPASKGARPVIRAAADQAPAQRPATQEDVFGAQEQQQSTATPTSTAQNLSGTRTLSGAPRVFTGEPLSMNLKDADLRDVLRTFAELTGLNMAIDPGVGGSVTVDFTDVPWDQALDLILRQNNLTFVLEGNVMRIGTIERIASETQASRRLAEEERLNVPLTTLSFKLSYARAQEVSVLLKEIASPRARIIVDARTNQLIISEIPQFLQTMQNLITTVDVPTRQVMIEARIVESSRTFTQQWGFDWNFGGDLDPALGTGTGLVFPNRIGYTGGPFNFSAGRPVLALHLFDVLGSFNLDLALSAAESAGFIKVVSAPRVTTQDNQAAEIQSGFQIPYQTRVNFTTTVTYLDATLRLSVTPQITEAGTVIMDIAVQKNEPAPGLSIVGAAGTPLTTRQARTRLMVRDGGTAVIAGIFQTKDNEATTRMPFVHNIPVLGALFRSHDVTTSHDELLIFITPRIVRG